MADDDADSGSEIADIGPVPDSVAQPVPSETPPSVPPAALPPAQPAGKPSGKGSAKVPAKAVILIAAIAAAVVFAGVVFMLYRPQGGVITINTTTSTTTTINSTITTTIPGSQYQIYSCTTISRPGIYGIVSNITTKNTSAPCIRINSGGVVLDGNGKSINGNGPYIETVMPSYGVYAANITDITVKNVSIGRFSYGVYLSGVNDSGVAGVKTLNSTLSGIYMNNSYRDTLSNDTIDSAESGNGGLHIDGGGNNTVENSSMKYNAYYGVYLNSTGNKFYRDTLLNNPVDFECGPSAYSRYTNSYGKSSCQINQYCNFATCRTKNTPYDINSKVLGGVVSSCGSIDNSGVYTLVRNLNLTDYVNTSEALPSGGACITINSPDVKLDCSDYTIANARYGVMAQGPYNTSVVNCRFRNDTYGLYENAVIGLGVRNIKAYNGTYGVYLNNTTGSMVSNLTASGNEYGIYLEDSSGSSLYNLSNHGNTYGIYVNGAQGNGYYSGTLANNTKGDLYCSTSSYNSSKNTYNHLSCGSSDCKWATSCKAVLPTPLLVTPLRSCGTIGSSGNYSLTTGLLYAASGACITVNADNVSLDCNDNMLQGSGTGSAILVQDRSNVKLRNCRASNFDYGFNVANSSYVTISNANVSSIGTGIYVSNSIYSAVESSKVTTFSDNAFVLSNTNYTVVTDNIASQGNLQKVPFMFIKATNDIIAGNNAQNNGEYGFALYGSRNNSIHNNTETGNGVAGYYCDPYSSGLYAQESLVNYGVGKQGCIWMVEENPQVSQTCSAILSPSTVELGQDMLYTYGATCFNVVTQKGGSANNTLINCNGHTILATNGGTFVGVSGASGTTLENCYLKNFTYGVDSNGPQTAVINNTMAGSQTAIEISQGGDYSSVRNNTILNSSYGIDIAGANYASIRNNGLAGVNISIELSGSLGSSIYSNLAKIGRIGLYLINATESLVGGNLFTYRLASGITCNAGSSNVSTINRDEGGNVCSSNNACYWMTSSPSCKA